MHQEKNPIMPIMVSGARLRWWRVIPAILLLALFGGAIGRGGALPGARADGAADPLPTLNDAFRAAYRRAKEADLARGGPVILAVGDSLVLRRGAARQEVRYTPAVYHMLKMVAHVPLALDVLLATHEGTAEVDAAALDELRRIRGLIDAASPALETSGLSPEQLARARVMFAASRGFLDTVVQARKCSRDERVAFARQMNPLVMKNAAEAARAELDGMHARVSAWRREMSDAEWQALRVVILGSPAPREQNLAVQYFARLLDQPGEGRRIVYAESIRDEQKALDFLAAYEVDTTIGVDFFNDPERMHRDLLSDAAQEYLPLLIDRP